VAQNRGMSPSVNGQSIGGLHNLGKVLPDFVPSGVAKEYGDDWGRVLNVIETQLQPKGKFRRTSKSMWP
jgi:hypothetical protein